MTGLPQFSPPSLDDKIAAVDAKKAQFKSIGSPTLESLLSRLRVELTYASNALEGNTLSLRETQLIVEEGLSPGLGKTLRKINEAKNHFDAIKMIEQWARVNRPHSVRAVLEIHSVVMRGIDDAWKGRLRNSAVFLRGTQFIPPNAAKVPEMLDAVVEFANCGSLHPIVCAAESHFRFESTHPFFDGNGRTKRLLMNWQLLRAGYPITIIQVEDRAPYLHALDAGHAGNLQPLQFLILNAVERSLNLALDQPD